MNNESEENYADYLFGDALKKLERYCTYQDRCHQEVEQKLKKLGVSQEIADEVIIKLIEDQYLNEQRFANSFARGKFRIKSWGKEKIKRALEGKEISAYCIANALLEIDDKEYYEKLEYLINKRVIKVEYSKKERFNILTDIMKFSLSKGYEYDLAKEIGNAILDELENSLR